MPESSQLMKVTEFLRNPSAYEQQDLDIQSEAAPAGRVEVRETHISIVFLTEHYAYKLKKGVRLDFLDFSTLALRKAACMDELRLNRRLAPSVYLDVLPVTVDEQGHLALDGAGEPVEWVVKMRRLAEQHTLQAMIEAERVRPSDVERIMQALGSFFSQQPPAAITVDEYLERFNAHIQANRSTLLATSSAQSAQTSAAQIEQIHESLFHFLEAHRDQLDQRVRQGRVIESHGDLRPEHVYLTPDPVFLDCIEFNAEFRTNDMLDEVCFLTMECQQLGAKRVADWVLDAYRRASDDDASRELADFYVCYRACVRAKVHLLRAGQLDGSAAREAAETADRYLGLASLAAKSLTVTGGAGAVREAKSKSTTMPALSMIVVRGPSGVGKTTVAAALAARLGCPHLQTDAVRQELLSDEADGHATAHNTGKYSLENRRRVYENLLQRASELLEHQQSVVVDGTFLRREWQQMAVDVANAHQAPALIVNCSCPSATAMVRINRRAEEASTLSEARAQTHQRQLAEQELPEAGVPQCDVDTTTNMQAILEKISDCLCACERV